MQGIFHNCVLFVFAQQQTNRRRIVRFVAHQIVHHRQVAIELPGVLKLKVRVLQLNHHIAMQSGMVEKQVNKKLLPNHLKPVLTAHKGNAHAEFDQKVFEVVDQRFFDLALVRRLKQA